MHLEDHKLLVSKMFFYSQVIPLLDFPLQVFPKQELHRLPITSAMLLSVGWISELFMQTASTGLFHQMLCTLPQWHELLIYPADIAFDEVVQWFLSAWWGGGRGCPNKWRRSPLGRLHSYTPHYPLNRSLWGRAQFLGSANHWQKQLENHLKDLVLLEKKKSNNALKDKSYCVTNSLPLGKKKRKKSTDRGSKEEQRTDLDSTGLSHPHRQTATTIKQ